MTHSPLSAVFTVAAIFVANAYDIHTKALTPITEKEIPAGAEMAFVKDGKCDFSIAYDRKNQLAAKAAELLEGCFEKATGAKPAGGRYTLAIMPSEDAKDQTVSVKTSATGVKLSGNALYSALDFAERFLGVRWYFPGETGTINPQIKDLVIKPVWYEDSPWFEGNRGDKFYPYTSVKDPTLVNHWKPYLGESLKREDVTGYMDYWRVGGRGCGGGGHSPRPEVIAKAHPDKLKTIFYTSPYGKFWYNPGGHVGNFWNVLDLTFADLLIEDWKAFYDSKGKDDRGGYKDSHNAQFCSFGVCDTYMPISEVQTDPVVKELGLVKESDLERDKDAGMCNIYARFYQHLGNRLKETMPDKRLFLLIYYNSKVASLDKRYVLPDNVELNVCDGRLPGKTRNAMEMEKSIRLFREWYEGCGNRPVLKAWLYAPRFDPFGRSIKPEFIGDVPKVLGKYLSRKGGVFYDYDGGFDMWHYFYSVYAGNKAQWNPDFDVDCAIDEMMDDLYGKAAGAWMKKFHRDLKAAYVRHTVQVEKDAAPMPREVIDALENDLAEAKKRLKEGTVEMKRFGLIADYWPKAFETQRALADYEPPVYDVKRYVPDLDWEKVKPLPLVITKTGAAPEVPAALRLAWDEKGLYGRFEDGFEAKADISKDMWFNDSVEFFFCPGLGKEVQYQLAYDCLDREFVQKQRFLPIPQAPDASYRAKGFNHTSKVLAKGWNSEFFVPWSVFDESAPKVYDQWNANVVHNKYGAKRETCGSSFTLGINGNREMFGILRFTGRGD